MLGLSVGARSVRAVLVKRGAIAWAGQASYGGLGELAEVIAHLAGEAGEPVRRARVVLEREVIQLRSLVPCPPLKGSAIRRWVALEAPRLFRKNGAQLVTDAVLVPLSPKVRALWAAAVAEPLVRTVLGGCEQAGLHVEALGPASEILLHAVAAVSSMSLALPTGELLDIGPGCVWRSRLLRIARPADGPTWHPALASLGAEAGHFAPAYAAATTKPASRLQLLPADTQAARERVSRSRLIRVLAVAFSLWAMAATVYVLRLVHALHTATQALGTISASVDRALSLRRDLDAATHSLSLIAAADQARSRHLALLAELTRALDDSTSLLTVQVGADRTARLVGYAPRAAKVLAELERVERLRDVRMEGPVTRERGEGRGEMDRFAIVARLESRP